MDLRTCGSRCVSVELRPKGGRRGGSGRLGEANGGVADGKGGEDVVGIAFGEGGGEGHLCFEGVVTGSEPGAVEGGADVDGHVGFGGERGDGVLLTGGEEGDVGAAGGRMGDDGDGHLFGGGEGGGAVV